MKQKKEEEEKKDFQLPAPNAVFYALVGKDKKAPYAYLQRGKREDGADDILPIFTSRRKADVFSDRIGAPHDRITIWTWNELAEFFSHVRLAIIDHDGESESPYLAVELEKTEELKAAATG